MSHIVLRRLLKLNWRVLEQGYLVISSRRIGKAKRRDWLGLERLQIEPLKKLRHKPQRFEVIHYASMGIHPCIRNEPDEWVFQVELMAGIVSGHRLLAATC